MPWASNPLSGPGNTTAPNDIEAAAGSRSRDGANDTGAASGSASASGSGSSSPEPKNGAARSKFRPPSDHFTLHQIFYIFILDGIVSAIFAGGINFAIAYALYHNRGTADSPIRLFQFPNTLAGDTAVTIFVQFLTTWVIEAVLVNFDLRKGGVQAIGFVPEPSHRRLRWFAFLDLNLDRGRAQRYTIGGPKQWFAFLFAQVLRSLILAVIFFPPIFGASIGFLTLVGTRHHGSDWDWYYDAEWAPEIFKLVQGAVLGLLFTPPMAVFWLARCGWALQALAREEEEGERGEVVEVDESPR